MKQVLFLLLLLAIGAGAFAALAVNLDRLDPVMLRLGLDPDGWVLEELLTVVAVIVIGVPLGAVLWAVASLGSEGASTDVDGYKVLRLKAGTRYGFAVLSLLLAGLCFYAVATDAEATLAFKIIVPGFGVSLVYVAVLLLVAKVRYDGAKVWVTHFNGRLRRHDWADLTDIRTNAEGREHQLIFRDGRKARISFYYQDVSALMTLANRKQEQNARTP